MASEVDAMREAHRMTLREALERARQQVAADPEHLRIIYRRNDELIAQLRRQQRGEQ
jgi:hypothetical protein